MNTIILERAKACCNALVLGMLLSILPASAWSAQAIINPSQDNTVAQELADNSSGACESIFSGMIDVDTLDGARRVLIQFDIAGNIPANSTITGVTLSMMVTRGDNHADSTFTLHPIDSAWVEGIEGCGARGGGQGELSTGGVTWNTMPGNGAASYPNIADGDVAPYGAPNGQVNAGDLTVMIRLALGLEDARALELAHGDLGTPDSIINAADVILLIQMLHSQ